MNKILVAVFDTETAAYEGLSALKELNASGDITLNATAIIAKSADGTLGLRQAAEQGPGSTALGADVEHIVSVKEIESNASNHLYLSVEQSSVDWKSVV